MQVSLYQTKSLVLCANQSTYNFAVSYIFNKFGHTEYKSREVGNALRVLERAMLLYLRYPVTGVKLPLQQDFNKSPRLQFLDTGMLCYSVGAQAALISDEKIDAVFDGMIAEHVVGQELMTTNTIQITKPLFWVRDNPQANAELDFIRINGTEIMPIEVKAGKNRNHEIYALLHRTIRL